MNHIGLLNESTLHSQLKQRYCTSKGKTEVKVGSYICDIVLPGDKIIEIQTANISAIRNKLASLSQEKKLEVIFPVVENNFYRLYVEKCEGEREQSVSDGKRKKSTNVALDSTIQYKGLTLYEASYRKSPKHKSFFSLFREISGCYFLLDNPNLTLRLIYVDVETTRVALLGKNGKLKKAHTVDKKLISIRCEETFDSVKSILKKTFSILPEVFSSQEVKNVSCVRDASYTLWLLKKMSTIEVVKKENRKVYYSEKKDEL